METFKKFDLSCTCSICLECLMIYIKAFKATSRKDKALGLMFRNPPIPLYFETRFGIHTFFVKAPIFVYILDKNSHVVSVKRVNPWRVYFWNPKYSRVLELPTDHPGVSKIDKDTKCSLTLYP